MRVIQTQQGVCERATPIQATISVRRPRNPNCVLVCVPVHALLEVYNQTQVMFTPSTNWTALKKGCCEFLLGHKLPLTPPQLSS